VLKAVATRGEGIDEAVQALADHHHWAVQGGALQRRRRRRAAGEIEAITVTALRARVGALQDGQLLDDLAAAVASGRNDPYTAADQLLAGLGTSASVA
jgi:LAO/AO transport system kinase